MVSVIHAKQVPTDRSIPSGIVWSLLPSATEGVAMKNLGSDSFWRFNVWYYFFLLQNPQFPSSKTQKNYMKCSDGAILQSDAGYQSQWGRNWPGSTDVLAHFLRFVQEPDQFSCRLTLATECTWSSVTVLAGSLVLVNCTYADHDPSWEIRPIIGNIRRFSIF